MLAARYLKPPVKYQNAQRVYSDRGTDTNNITDTTDEQDNSLSQIRQAIQNPTTADDDKEYEERRHQSTAFSLFYSPHDWW